MPRTRSRPALLPLALRATRAARAPRVASGLAVVLFAGASSVGCETVDGCDNGSLGYPDAWGPAIEASSPEAGTTLSEAETAVDAGAEAAPAPVTPAEADAGPLPTPRALDTEPGCMIQGVTDDGYVVYSTEGAVKAVPVVGGTPVTLAGAPGNATVVHDVVFVWTGFGDDMLGVGNLAIWTSRMSAPQQVSTTSTEGVAAASADSSLVVYAGGAPPGRATTSLYAASVSALGSPTEIAKNLDTTLASCIPVVAFSGAPSAAPGVAGPESTAYAIAYSCDVGSGLDAVTSYASPTWKANALTNSAPGFSSDNAGEHVALSVDATGRYAAVVVDAGQLEIAPLGGGRATPIDAADAMTAGQNGMNLYPADFGGPFFGNMVASSINGATNVYLSKTDAFVLYATAAGELRSSTVGASAPRSLVAGGAAFLDAVSPDEAWALFDSGQSPQADLSLVSTSGGGAVRVLATPRGIAIMGDPFTADSRYAVFMTDLRTDSNDDTIGTLVAVSVSSPGALIPLASRAASNDLLSASDAQLGGSKLSFVDGFDASVGTMGAVDIHVIDLAATNASSVLVRSVDPMYAVSFDRAHIVYTVTQGGSGDGLYAVPVP